MAQPSKCLHGIDLDQDCRDCEMESLERRKRVTSLPQAKVDDMDDPSEDEFDYDASFDEEEDDFDDEDEIEDDDSDPADPIDRGND